MVPRRERREGWLHWGRIEDAGRVGSVRRHSASTQREAEHKYVVFRRGLLARE